MQCFYVLYSEAVRCSAGWVVTLTTEYMEGPFVDHVRGKPAAAPPPACDAERAVTASLAARAPEHTIRMPPPPQLQHQPQLQPELVHVQLAQVPRGEGTVASWDRRARRARDGNRQGRERRLL